MSSSNTTSAKPALTANIKPSRPPAPTLFVGPPSRTTSTRSIPRPSLDNQPHGRSSRDGGGGTGSQQLPRSTLSRSVNNTTSSSEAHGDTPTTKPQRPPTASKPSNKSIDARWREMQSTLDEVELTAQSSTHVFGTAHAAALEELRNAQVALAQAWGRAAGGATNSDSNADENGDATKSPEGDGAQQAPRLAAAESDIERFRSPDGGPAAPATPSRGQHRRPRADTETSGSTNLSGESFWTEEDGDAGSTKTRGSRMEEDTARDIRRASERRAANAAYFRKVDAGVKEVVEKLEKVAEAMRGVEAESRSLWSERSESEGGEGEGQGDGSGKQAANG